MAGYSELKKYYYIDFIVEILLKLSGLSCRNVCGKQKNIFLFFYSSTIVFVAIYYTLFVPYLITYGDTIDRIIDTLFYLLNVTNMIVTYWSNVLTEKAYWSIISDLRNVELDHGRPLERKKYKYYTVSLITCVNFVLHIFYLYLCVFPTYEESIKTAPFLRLFSNYYCSMSTCRIARVLSLIETKYVLLNSQYEKFSTTADETRLDLLKKYKKINRDLGDAVRGVQKFFSLGLLVDISRGFYFIYFGTYWVIRKYHNQEDTINPVKIILSIYLQIIKIVTLASVCSGIEDEIKKSKRRIDKIMESCNTTAMQKEVISLGEEIRDPVCVSAYGMFNINYTLLLEMAGGYITNIFMILQLRFPSLIRIPS